VRVLIIGAGIGGMALAHGLRKSGIDVRVFERRTGGSELAGYGIHINAFGLQALEDCLPSENWQRFLAGSAPAPDVVTFHDQHLGRLLRREGRPGDRRGVSRTVLQAALRDGMEVQPGKKLVDCEVRADGLAHALFEDGTSASGDVLVGADGASSRVRDVRLPDLEREDLGVLNIAGRFLLNADRKRALPATLTDGSVNNVVPDGPGWMFAAAWDDYVTWAYAGARPSYPAGVEQLSGEALRDLVLDRMAGWNPALRRLVRDCEADTVTAIPLKSMPHHDPWQPSPVTLLGDAIHNMTPMAGIGANTALRDAYHLRRALQTAHAGHTGLTGAIAEYESTMRAYANPAVAMSARNARTAGSEARFPRLAFRTALRVAEAVPPMKRAMFRGATAAAGAGIRPARAQAS
jgi:2-polyprenyl-6-methoxyphenol hydroxylase-like FAD-dependent oxidoreductase